MITDEERREIAARMRKVNPYRNQSYTVPYNRYTPAAEYLARLAGALGYSPKNDVSRLEFQNRLADLIEPSCDRDTPQKVAKEMFGKMRHSTKEEADAYDAMLKSKSVELHPVDRDALLDLADKMDAYSIQFGTGLQACTIQAWAFSIRESLGVSK